MSTAKTIKLKDHKGNMLYSYRCENNSYKITLEKAIEEHAALNGLLLIGADLSEMKFTHWFISDATFINCDMSRTMWDAVQMYSVVFQKVSFKMAVIKNSEIVDSAFFWGNLAHATFEKDVLSNNIFSFYVGSHNTKFKEVKRFETCFFDNDLIKDNETLNIDSYYPINCPSHGSFIGWKKVMYKDGSETGKKSYALVKLEIPEDAKRSSASTSSRKCRCSKAKVLEIVDVGTQEPLTRVTSKNFTPTEYIVGEMVYPDSFDDNRWHECSHGIHFFINKEDALNY